VTDGPDASSSTRPGRRNAHRARSKGRELALKYLYSADLKRQIGAEDFDAFVVHQGERGPMVPFARELVLGTLADQDAIDDLLSGLAANWSLHRMAAVDRNVLRLGCYELLRHSGLPPGVVINEAVEIAKKFGTKDSAAFVNGLLDRVRKKRDAGEFRLPDRPPDAPQES
jgi:N utilization substance protein B